VVTPDDRSNRLYKTPRLDQAGGNSLAPQSRCCCHVAVMAMCLLDGIQLAALGLVSSIVLYGLLGIVGVIVAFLVFFLAVARFENQRLVGHFEPVTAPWPHTPSSYWLKTRERAAGIGLQPDGDLATIKSHRKVRGLLSLFYTEDRLVLASIVSSTSAIGSAKRTMLRSKLSNGGLLESTDCPGLNDLTGVTKHVVLLNAGIEELLRFHRHQVQATGLEALPFTGPAREENDHLAHARGGRLVMLKLARWTNPQETSLRFTWRGAWVHLTGMFSEIGKLQAQQHRTHVRRAG